MEQMQDNIQPFYHGTDMKVLCMTAEQRNGIKSLAHSIIRKRGDMMGYLYGCEATKSLIENSKSTINYEDYATAYCAAHEYINGDKDYEYPNGVIYLTQYKSEAWDFAKQAFAFGELGYIAYVFCKVAEIVAPAQLSEQEKAFVNFVECCERMPVVLKFTSTDIDINLLRFEDGRELYPEFIERLKKGERLCAYRYLGSLPMSKEKIIPFSDNDVDMRGEIDDYEDKFCQE